MAAVLGFILNSLIQVSSMVFVPSLVLQRFMGVSINIIIPVIVVIAVVYTMAAESRQYLDDASPDIGNMGRPDRRNGFPVLKE
mgnify:CR=1 FL=1